MRFSLAFLQSLKSKGDAMNRTWIFEAIRIVRCSPLVALIVFGLLFTASGAKAGGSSRL